MFSEPLIFDICSKSKNFFGECDVESQDINKLIPSDYLAQSDLDLPEVAEVDIIRHYTHLAEKNYSIDRGLYPLGSCTMKYNPKVNEDISKYAGFTSIHPYQPEDSVQGALQILYEMEQYLCQISGMDKITFQPAAGAHGETTGLMLIKAYHDKQQEGRRRNKIIVPDSAHGTNPASTTGCGYKVVEVKSDSRGNVDLFQLKGILNDEIAALMLTNPNTLGLFEENILEISDMVHKAGGLLYYDGANLNALLGMVRPSDMGFDIMHFNLHKTFSTPHGSGGPGSGPVGVKENLEPFLPYPIIAKKEQKYYLDYNRGDSIGRVKSFYGNFNVIVKAYAYICALGAKGLPQVAEDAVLNANYLMNNLKKYFNLPYNRGCMHEFVVSPRRNSKIRTGVLDIAKRLIDYGYHPPTVCFPLIVADSLMIEPTETESKRNLDDFINVLVAVVRESENTPDLLRKSPHCNENIAFPLSVSRLDEARAARKLVLKYKDIVNTKFKE